jgi:HAE1 family hydrophobic/amphiphilic exporter-1
MRPFLVFAILVLAIFGNVRAQVSSPTPQVRDAKKIQPEKLEGVPQIAPKFQKDESELPELGRVGVDMMNQRPLTLRETLVLALENNKDIEVSRQNVRSAEFDLTSARGFYDPHFTGQTYYDRSTTPNLSIFSPNATTTNGTFLGNANYQGALRKFGSTYNAGFSRQRLTTDNPISLLDPQINSSLSFSITQPILRGRGFDSPRRAIEIAKRNLSLTDAQFRQKSIETIAAAQRAYWDLTFALRNLQVQRDSVRDAKEQLEHNKRLLEEGVLAPIDVVAAETQVANFEQFVYDALNQVSIAENNLKNLIAKNREDEIWNASLVPVDPVDLNVPVTTLSDAVETAMQNRPELELNDVALGLNQIDRRFYNDQKKPQIDFIATYTANGVGGDVNPNFRSPFGGSTCDAQCQLRLQTLTGSSISDLFVNRYPTFRVGIQFNLPVFGKTAEAQYGKSLVEQEKIKTQREQLEQLIQSDVRNTLQFVRTAEARLRAAAISRENTVKQYESERRKLEVGQSNIYLVLERQTALMNARSNELRAQTELNKSIAELQRATGNSLKANNVEARLR